MSCKAVLAWVCGLLRMDEHWHQCTVPIVANHHGVTTVPGVTHTRPHRERESESIDTH